MAPTVSRSNSPPEIGTSNTKLKVRRVKANHRERTRMHGLNHALDTLRQCIPVTNEHQKLSKIETLRIARNYITVLDRMLNGQWQPSPLEYARILSDGMSQTTTNLIATMLKVPPRLVMSPNCFLSPSSVHSLPYQHAPPPPSMFYSMDSNDLQSGSDSSFEMSPQQIPHQQQMYGFYQKGNN